MLFDPGRIRQAEWTMSELPDTAPAYGHGEGSTRLSFSGLNHTTFDLAVCASQDGLPHRHARLASGCWSGFTRRDSYPQSFIERFQSSSLVLLPRAYLTQGHPLFPGTRELVALPLALSALIPLLGVMAIRPACLVLWRLAAPATREWSTIG